MNQASPSTNPKLQGHRPMGEYPDPVRCPKCNGLLFMTGIGFSGPVEIKCGKCKAIIKIR